MAGGEIVRLSPEELQDPKNLVPALLQIEGYTSLSEQDRNWLLEHTAGAVTNYRKAAMHALMWCIDVGRVDKFLQDKGVSTRQWCKKFFPQARTSFVRTVETYRELTASADEDSLIYLAEHGIPGMHNMQAGHVAKALKKLPPPKVNRNFKSMSEWRLKLAEKLRDNFVRAAKHGADEKIPREDACLFIAQAVKLGIKKADQIETSKQSRDLVAEAVSYAMDKLAISGTITITGKAAPEGFWPKVGYPRGKKRKI